MTFTTNQINGLPAVEFRNGGDAAIAGTLFSAEQYIVLRNPNASSGFTQWGAAMGDVNDQYGYMFGNDSPISSGTTIQPAAVSDNGTYCQASGHSPSPT